MVSSFNKWNSFYTLLPSAEAVAQRCSVEKVIKKRLWHRCFPGDFAKSLRTPFLTEHLRRLLLLVKRPLENVINVLWKYYWRSSLSVRHMEQSIQGLSNEGGALAIKLFTQQFLHLQRFFFCNTFLNKSSACWCI